MELFHGRPAMKGERQEKEMLVYDLLDKLHIAFDRVDHEPAWTIAGCGEIDRVLGIRMCKNLFLCNRQKTKFYLLALPGDKPLQAKELSKQIPSSRLSFASGEDMEKYLNVSPGSATLLGLIFDPEHKVQLLVDEEILAEPYFGCHPCVNTSSIKMKTEDMFQKVLKETGHDYIAVHLSGEPLANAKSAVKDV